MEACVILGVVAMATILVLLCNSRESPEVTLASLTVTKFNFTGDHISGNWNMQFQVRNPNLANDLFYGNVNFTVYHGKNRLGSTLFPRFAQKGRETTTVHVTIHLIPGTTARGIGNDLTTYSFAEFDVKLTTVVKWLLWSSEYVTISCDDVAVGLLEAAGGHGKMIGPARKCKVS